VYLRCNVARARAVGCARGATDAAAEGLPSAGAEGRAEEPLEEKNVGAAEGAEGRADAGDSDAAPPLLFRPGLSPRMRSDLHRGIDWGYLRACLPACGVGGLRSVQLYAALRQGVVSPLHYDQVPLLLLEYPFTY
jgi:hypothetical protein